MLHKSSMACGKHNPQMRGYLPPRLLRWHHVCNSTGRHGMQTSACIKRVPPLLSITAILAPGMLL